MAPSKEFTQKLGNLSGGVANAYRRVMDGSESAKLIFERVDDDDVITEQESEALRLIVTEGNLPDPERKVLVKLLLDNWEALTNATRKRVKGDALKRYYNALQSPTVAKLTFWSPGTWILYDPTRYQVIGSLVKSGEIKVYEVFDGGLSRKLIEDSAKYNLATGGTNRSRYDPQANELIMMSDDQYIEHTIVHEMTHAVQDWGGSEKEGIYLEADAYIAQAVVMTLSGLKTTQAGKKYPLGVAMEQAAPLVLDRKAERGNQKWNQAYSAVYDSMKLQPSYAALVNDKKMKVTNPDETRQFYGLWYALADQRHW
jgi:hypothetical protein